MNRPGMAGMNTPQTWLREGHQTGTRRRRPTFEACPHRGAVRSADPADRRRWGGLAAALLVAFMGVVNVFVVTAAAPSIQADLGASFAQIQLVLAGYALAYAVGLVTGGRLGDLYGRKRLLVAGLGAFVLASAACWAAPTPTLLIAARLLQGLTAAAMLPQVLSVIQVSFHDADREVALGLYGATIGLGTITGQLIGGLLLAANVGSLGWRLVFLVNAPVGIVAIAGALAAIRESRAPAGTRLDLGGAALMGAGLLTLLLPLVEGSAAGWPAWTLASLAAAGGLLLAFVHHERRLALRGGMPLLPPRLFAERGFAVGMCIVVVYYSGNSGLFLLLAYYLQGGLGLSPLAAGLAFAPSGVGYMVSSLAARHVVAHLDNRACGLGALLMVAGLLGMIGVTEIAGDRHQAWAMAPVLGLSGLGWGLVTNPLMATVLAQARRGEAGAASGALLTATQVAGALGVAVLGAVFVSLLGANPQDPRVRLRPELFAHAFTSAALLLLVLATTIFLLVQRLPRVGGWR